MAGGQRLWHAWPLHNRPASSHEETAFVYDLRRRTEPDSRYVRDDITTLVNAFRCALTVDELLHAAPGVKLERLLGAWDHVAALQQAGRDAWNELVHHPTSDTLYSTLSLIERASFGLGRNCRQLVTIADHQQRSAVIASLDTKVSDLHHEADVLEQAMTTASDSSIAQTIGRRLYDPYHPCLWANPLYLPRRVGDIMPLTLAKLLGERH